MGKFPKRGGGSQQNKKIPKDIFDSGGGGQGEKCNLIFGILHRGKGIKKEYIDFYLQNVANHAQYGYFLKCRDSQLFKNFPSKGGGVSELENSSQVIPSG